MTIASIPAVPTTFPLPPDRTGLILIDFQRDFIQTGGYGELQCPSIDTFRKVASSVGPTSEVLNAARQAGITIVHTREGHKPDMSDCAPTKRLRQVTANPSRHVLCIGDDGPMGKLLVRGEYGHDIIDQLTPLPNEVVLDKPGKGCFYNTNLHQILQARGITHLLFAGVTTECCVATTFREANDRGYECCVLEDCTGGFDSKVVSMTTNLFSAYDGLFGYRTDSSTAVAALKNYQGLAHKPARLSLQTLAHEPCDILSSVAKLPVIEPVTLGKAMPGPLTGAPFVTSQLIPIQSVIAQKFVQRGALFLGSVASSPLKFEPDSTSALVGQDVVSFVVDIDVDGNTHADVSSSNTVTFTPSQGYLATTGTTTVSKSDRVSITGPRVVDVRTAFASVMEPFFGEAFETATDFRGVQSSSLKMGYLSVGLTSEAESLASFLGCAKVQVDYKPFSEAIEIKTLLINTGRLAKVAENSKEFVRLSAADISARRANQLQESLSALMDGQIKPLFQAGGKVDFMVIPAGYESVVSLGFSAITVRAKGLTIISLDNDGRLLDLATALANL